MQFIFSSTECLSFPEISLLGQKPGTQCMKHKKGEREKKKTRRFTPDKPTPKKKEKVENAIVIVNCRSFSFVDLEGFSFRAVLMDLHTFPFCRTETHRPIHLQLR